MARFNFEGGTAVVTGAASGIGEAVASALAERGCNLVLLDVVGDRLAAVASTIRSRHSTVDVEEHVVDLADPVATDAVAAYDRAVTAPLHGFADEEDYWRRASSKPYLARVRRPTLLLSALDDPFIPGWSLPDPRTLPPDVRAEFVSHGGHVGFVEGRPWRASSWAERRAVEFLATVLDPPGVC